MNIIHALTLGIVEGATEFLPISSTAHLQITSWVMGLAQTDFIKTFEISIQLGAIFAMIFAYSNSILKLKKIWKPLLVAFLPTAFIGYILYKIIKIYFLGNNWLVVATLFLGGIAIIFFEYFSQKKEGVRHSIKKDDEISDIKISTAFWIGLAQSFAVMPGVSRSASTIITGRLLGVGRIAIVEFSFLLSIPTMIAATSYDIFKNSGSFNIEESFLLFVGFITAFISAFFTIRFFLNYIKSHSFAIFGIYRIIIAVIFALFLI